MNKLMRFIKDAWREEMEFMTQMAELHTPNPFL